MRKRRSYLRLNCLEFALHTHHDKNLFSYSSFFVGLWTCYVVLFTLLCCQWGRDYKANTKKNETTRARAKGRIGISVVNYRGSFSSRSSGQQTMHFAQPNYCTLQLFISYPKTKFWSVNSACEQQCIAPGSRPGWCKQLMHLEEVEPGPC